jgi:N-methylhydantoinase B
MTNPGDVFEFELFKNSLYSLADEMALTVLRTSYSSVLKGSMDYSTAICDAQGRMVAQGLTLPQHLGSIPTALASVLGHYDNEMQGWRRLYSKRPVRRRYAPARHLPVQADILRQ